MVHWKIIEVRIGREAGASWRVIRQVFSNRIEIDHGVVRRAGWVLNVTTSVGVMGSLSLNLGVG